jgi:hypothetical protein
VDEGFARTLFGKEAHQPRLQVLPGYGGLQEDLPQEVNTKINSDL